MGEREEILELKTEEQNLAIGVKTRVNNAVHVEVEVVELHAVGVRFRNVDGRRNAIGVLVGLFLDDFGDRKRVPIGQPTVERRHAHGFGVVLSSVLDRVSVLFASLEREICKGKKKKKDRSRFVKLAANCACRTVWSSSVVECGRTKMSFPRGDDVFSSLGLFGRMP